MKYRSWMRFFSLWCLAAIWLSVGSSALVSLKVSAEEMDEVHNNQAAIVISISRFSFLEMEPGAAEAMPNLQKILPHSNVGAMNIRTQGGKMDDVYVSIGAGKPTDGWLTRRSSLGDGGGAGELAWR